jgi:hypothetical protein
MKTENRPFPPQGEQSGFALILTIMALLLLTFLGLTLAATTTTELQIATNYRWSQQAYYNAEAGLAVAKAFLQQVNMTPNLPDPRTWDQPDGDPPPDPIPFPVPLVGGTTRSDVWGNPPRHMEPKVDPAHLASMCDKFGAGAGYGVILDDADFSDGSPGLPGELPLQNQTTIGGVPLRGAFTVWVRRDLSYQDTGPGSTRVLDDTVNPVLILTAEGVAPAIGAAFAPAAGDRRFYANRAVRVLEAKISIAQGGNACKGTMPQASETGFHCLPLDTGGGAP